MIQNFAAGQSVTSDLGDGMSGTIVSVETDGSRYPYNAAHYVVRYDGGAGSQHISQTGTYADRDLMAR